MKPNLTTLYFNLIKIISEKSFIIICTFFFLFASFSYAQNVNISENCNEENVPNISTHDEISSETDYYPWCRTFTVGINVLGLSLSTEVTICCTSAPQPRVLICHEINRLDKSSTQNPKIAFDISKLFDENNEKPKKVEILSSSIEEIDGKRMELVKGVYQVDKDNFIYVDYIVK
jgi:hypothetical protein